MCEESEMRRGGSVWCSCCEREEDDPCLGTDPDPPPPVFELMCALARLCATRFFFLKVKKLGRVPRQIKNKFGLEEAVRA